MTESRLVPAALGIRTDRKGTSWNVEPNGTIGRIGSTMVNSGLALKVDEESFSGFQPMMTSDGKEFVIPGRPFVEYPGLQVQRRIRLLEDEGILRYAEMLYNGSTDPISLTLSLHTNFSGNYQTFLTNRGRTEPVLLEDEETGIVVLPGVAQSSRAFLFSLAGSSSFIKPTISAQNRYGLNFQYPLTLAPGETRIILHQAAQVIIPQNFDRPNLIKLFRPFSFEETSSYLPEKWKDHLANYGLENSSSLAVPVEYRGIESLGIERGARDILALGEQTRLLGTASGDVAAVTSPYGSTSVPFDRIAALQGSRGGATDRTKLFLEDGQVFVADVEVPDLKFTQTGGDTISIDPADLDRLVFAKKPDGAEEEIENRVMLETYRGDRIHVSTGNAIEVSGHTQWGTLPIPLQDIVRVQPAPPRQSGHWAELTDGTKCLLYLNGEEMTLDSSVLGEIAMNTSELRGVFTLEESERQAWENEVGIRSVVNLHGSQRFVCDVRDSSLPVISEGLRVEVPSSKIRRIERLDEEAAPADLDSTFEIERWDGGVLIGTIDLDVLSLQVRGQDWKIPLRDIVRLETPSPELTAEALKEISALIEQLGDEDWNVREGATRELGAFGYLAGPVLRGKLRETKDPEVSRRIERILAGLN
ncbi:MAG: HEAT repeat domain-containing protein [Verrucomicrobiota bacterium]